MDCKLEIKLGNLSPVGILTHHLPARSRLLVKKPWITCNLYQGNSGLGEVRLESKLKARVYPGNQVKSKTNLALMAYGNLSIPIQISGELKVKVVGIGISHHVSNLISSSIPFENLRPSSFAAIGNESKGGFSFGYVASSGDLVSDPDYDIVTSLALAA